MWKDPIVEEVRKIREEHAARFGYDLNAIFLDLKAREEREENNVVSLPPREPVRIATKADREEPRTATP